MTAKATDRRPSPPPTVASPSGGIATGPRFLTANGSRDSHAITLASGQINGSPQAGTPYTGITWGEIRALVETPSATPKDSARFVVLSTYAEHDARTHDVQRARGVFGGLAIDIDTGNHPLTAILNALQAAVGFVRGEIYSSASATAENRKWRVLLRLADPIAGGDYADTQAALFELLAGHGVACDHALARPAQPVYLPNVPPDRRSRNGTPAFYQACHLPGPPLELAAGHAVIVLRERRRSERAEEATAAAARKTTQAADRKARVAAGGDDFDLIEHYNANHTIGDLFARYGFKRKPGRGSHWRSPLSTSGSFSTEDRGDHWITVSNWATAHNVGRPSRNGNRYGDAFDLFVHFEHAGDRTAAVRAYADEVRPAGSWIGAPVRIETKPAAGEPVPLDHWRQEMAATVAMEADRPGLKLLRGAPGCGKTYAVARAMAGKIGGLLPKTAGVVSAPGHEFCGELVDELRALGLEAAAYPKLDEFTCKNWEVAAQAQAAGLPVSATVCGGCPHRSDCRKDGYLALVKIADAAPHKVCTHERLARQVDRLTEAAQYLTIEEDPTKLLRPSVTTTPRALARLAKLADKVADATEREAILGGVYKIDSTPRPATTEWFADFAEWTIGDPAGPRDPDPPATSQSFFARVCEIADAIAVRCVAAGREATPEGMHEIELPAVKNLPRSPERAVWAALEAITRTADEMPTIDQEALTLALYAATGRLDRLYVQVDIDRRSPRRGRIVHAVGYWKTELPWGRMPVFVNDGTIDAGGLELLAGEPVEDITPTGTVAIIQPAAQYPVDILQTTSAAKVARILTGIVRAHPGRERVGVVMLKTHHDAILGERAAPGLLPADVNNRIVYATYYGAGPDRGSNEFHRRCDLVVVLGTLRPPPSEIRRGLVRRGQLDAANANATWGSIERRAADHEGGDVTYQGRGYAEAAWAAAADALTRAAVRQAVGRARAICPDGAAVVLVSTEDGGLPVLPAAVLPVADPKVDRIVEAVEAAGGTGATLESIVEAVGEPVRTVKRWIADAVAAGRVGRTGATTSTRYLPGPGPRPEEPAPAVAPTGAKNPISKHIGKVAPVGRGLRPGAPSPEPAAQPRDRAALPPDVLELLEERAGILEFDAGLDRDQAERVAWEEVVGVRAAAG